MIGVLFVDMASADHEQRRTPSSSQTEVATHHAANVFGNSAQSPFQPVHPGSNVHVLVQDMPKPPDGVLRITLKNPTWWEKFKQSLKALSPSQALQALKNEREKILTKARKGQPLTSDEVDFLNQSMRREITKVFDNFKQRAQEAVKITEEDDLDTVYAKLEIAEQLIQWLEALFRWMNKQIKEILSKVPEWGADRCIQEIRVLLRDMLSNITGEDHGHDDGQKAGGKGGAWKEGDGKGQRIDGEGGSWQKGTHGKSRAQQKL